MSLISPVDSLQSPRFSGIKTFMRLQHSLATQGFDFAVIGVPFDTGSTYRVGARFGPQSIRSLSSILRPHNIGLDVSIFDYCSGVDCGDLPVNPGYIEDSYQRIELALTPLLQEGVIPVLMGGDHSVTLPELRAITKKNGPVALVQFDSHLDTGDEYFGHRYNHGTVFRRAVEEGLLLVDNSIQVGIRGSVYSKDDIDASKRLGLEVLTSIECREMGLDRVTRYISERVGREKVFVSFDIDFVDPAYAPGTGTIEVGGFTSYESLQLVRGLDGMNFVGFDLVEVLPAYDPTEITALLGATIMFEFISLLALNKKRHCSASGDN
jgi:agmatinase